MWKRRDAGRTPVSGDNAETLAQQWLVRRGLKPVTRNYRCKAGEIDLVMRDGETLVFVEVRYRRHQQFGGSLESVDHRKQRKLARAASHFLTGSKQFQHLPCRFDVMAASPAENDNRVIAWQWVRNAFQPGP